MKSRRPTAHPGQAEELILTQFHSSRYIGGLTHGFYRYPATTSPDLVRELLLAHSDPDDVVLDPFMGGGTTVVESLAYGRRAIGGDLNSLGVFVTRAKTTPLTKTEWDEIFDWLRDEPLKPGIIQMEGGSALKLPRSLYGPVARALTRARFLRTPRQETLVRCGLLRMAQWALESSYLYPRRVDDRRNVSPSLDLLDEKLAAVLTDMHGGMEELISTAREHGIRKNDVIGRRLLLKGAAEDLKPTGKLAPFSGRVRLVVTSPPYPNVHVLYHRWQVEGRRETPAPYWIAGQSDGATLSYYIMGSRTEFGQRQYFERLERAFAALRPFLRRDGLVMQLVAFNAVENQLPRYLTAMERAGYRPCHSGRGPALVRDVPNRRWYARGNDLDAGREYLLVHGLQP
jgi:hypothetical protein